MTQRQRLIVNKPVRGKMPDVPKSAPKTTAPSRPSRRIAPLPVVRLAPTAPPAANLAELENQIRNAQRDADMRVPDRIAAAPATGSMATMEMPVTSFGIFHAQLIVGLVPIQRAAWRPRQMWLEYDAGKREIVLVRAPVPGTGQTIAQRSPWVPNQQDILASDWSLAKGGGQ